MKATTKLNEVAFPVMDYLQHAFLTRSLKNSDIKLWYVPIVMGKEWIDLYPARSRVSRKEKRFSCCPQLSYEIFVSGTYNECLAEYLRGLEEVPSGIRKLGATDEQIEDFKAIMDECYQALKKQA